MSLLSYLLRISKLSIKETNCENCSDIMTQELILAISLKTDTVEFAFIRNFWSVKAYVVSEKVQV